MEALRNTTLVIAMLPCRIGTTLSVRISHSYRKRAQAVAMFPCATQIYRKCSGSRDVHMRLIGTTSLVRIPQGDCEKCCSTKRICQDPTVSSLPLTQDRDRHRRTANAQVGISIRTTTRHRLQRATSKVTNSTVVLIHHTVELPALDSALCLTDLC